MTDLAATAAHVVALAQGHRAGSIDANVLVSRNQHGLTRFANSFIHQNVFDDSVSVHLTLAIDGRSTTVSTTAADRPQLAALVDTAVTSALVQPVDADWPGATPADDTDAVAHTTAHWDVATAQMSPQPRAQAVAAFISADEATLAAGYCDTVAVDAAFASTAGHQVQGRCTRATIDGIHQTQTSAGSAHHTSYKFEELQPLRLGRQAATRAHESATFTDVEPGAYEVILGPEAVATVMTFLGVYGFNAKSHRDGTSFVELGSQQFDDQLTIVEDPVDPRAIGLPFDAQGVPRQQTALVNAGVARNLVHDRRTAQHVGAQSTGNAMPGGESFGAVPMSMVVRAGAVDVDDMISATQRGLYVHQFHYCRVLDPKSQVVTGLTRNGTFLVEQGQIRGAVGNLRFTQSFVEALAPGRVLAVGNDDRYADGEFGPGMVICPSLHLGSWTFTGGARG